MMDIMLLGLLGCCILSVSGVAEYCSRQLGEERKEEAEHQ